MLVLEKCLNKEISAIYLSHWFDLYNWILCSGFNIDFVEKNCGELEIEIRYNITEMLDSLSFYEENDEYMDIGNFIDVFKSLDFVLKNIDK